MGYILLGLFWLFLFRFRNNRIHKNFNFEKNAPTCFRSGSLFPFQFCQPEASRDRRGRPRRISRQTFPKRTRILSILSKPHSFHSVHSAIGSRMNGIAPNRTQIPSVPNIPIPEYSQKNAPMIGSCVI